MRSIVYLFLLVLLSAGITHAQNIIFDSGSPVSHPGTNFDTSLVQTNTLGSALLGFLNSGGSRMSDEFEMSNSFSIDSIAFYIYITNGDTISTVSSYSLQIWDGKPSDSTSTVVWGNTTTNVLSSTSFFNAYRMTEGSTLLNRPIMRSFVDVGGLQLNPGTYWLDWTCSLIQGSAFAVPITIAGQDTTGNSIRFFPNNNTWSEALDPGTNAPQGMPFQIYGTQSSSPDVGLVAITQPTSGVLSASESITVRVANLESDPVDSIPVFVQINGGTPTSEVITASIPGGDSLDYTFTNTFDLSNSGNYTITAWVSLPNDADSSNDTLTLNVTNTLSVSDFATSTLSVFPNPVSDYLNIQSPGVVTTLRLVDQSGRVVYHDHPNAVSCKISLEALPQGTYILQLMVDGVWHTQKVVKQ
ncbi:MAG: T9SS C-terminal target domain-containing protein [Flavobacteriales bacterium]|nr:MAG: T9SS C-terminal target domain-containing protein [Flavobacteriales bacterium]